MRIIIYDEKGLREELHNVETVFEDDRNINVTYVDVHKCMKLTKSFKKVLIASMYLKVWEGENDY